MGELGYVEAGSEVTAHWNIVSCDYFHEAVPLKPASRDRCRARLVKRTATVRVRAMCVNLRLSSVYKQSFCHGFSAAHYPPVSRLSCSSQPPNPSPSACHIVSAPQLTSENRQLLFIKVASSCQCLLRGSGNEPWNIEHKVSTRQGRSEDSCPECGGTGRKHNRYCLVLR